MTTTHRLTHGMPQTPVSRRTAAHRLAALVLASMALLVATSARSAFASDSASPFSFAVLCDSRSSYAGDPAGTASPYYSDSGISPYFQNVAYALARETGVDFVVYPGDLVRGKKPALTGDQFATELDAFDALMQPVYSAGVPVYYVRGNHDAYEVSDYLTTGVSAAEIWREHLFQPGQGPNPAEDVVTWDTSIPGALTTFAFQHKGSLFVGLDEYPNGAKNPPGFDAAFLSEQLAAKVNHKFAFAHQPVWNYKTDELGPVDLADALQAGKVDVYFSGHVHSYQRIAEAGYRFQELLIGVAGAPQEDPVLVSGGSSGQYTPDPNLTVKSWAGGLDPRFGYAVVTVHADGSITTVMKFLDDPASPTSTVSTFDAANVTPR